jgi:putative pyrroloquinoline-quinone binding quinoprotein
VIRSKKAALAGMLAAAAALTPLVVAQTPRGDWPQWRGPNRDGTLQAFPEPAAWPEQLTRRWKVEVGAGYATPIVVGNRVYAFSRQQDNEVMRALDADTGKIVWETSYAAPFRMNPATSRHGPGPKSTPTYANGRLFTLGISGIVTAFDAATGKQVWQKPAPPVEPLYHTAQSALVDRDLVILHVGGHNQGALTAFDPETGAERWKWNGDGPSYGSPIVADIGGTRQVITLSQGERPPPLARAIHRALDDELDHAARLRRTNGDRVGPGQTADGLHGRPAQRPVVRRAGVGESAAVALVLERRPRGRRAVLDVGDEQRPVLLGGCADGQDAVDLESAAGRQCRDRPRRQSPVRPERRRRIDDRAEHAGRIRADEDLHRGRQRDLAGARHLG